MQKYVFSLAISLTGQILSSSEMPRADQAAKNSVAYPAQGTKPSPSVIGFTDHVQDAETDLVYMQQRYYDPIAGRFLSVDPIVTDANTGKGFGLYTYLDNNPHAKIDPDGRAAVSFEAVLGFGGGITIGYDSSTTELAITVSAGAGVSGGAQIDPRPGENGSSVSLRQHEACWGGGCCQRLRESRR